MALVHRKQKNDVGVEVEVEVEETVPVEEKTCDTPWENLAKGDIYPVMIKCQDYQPMTGNDMSCHTNLPIKAESVVAHLSPEHGANGGFSVQLRHRPGLKTSLWEDLGKAGVELHDFRCDICDEQLPLAPRRIIKHMAAHSGKTRQAKAGGLFHMTLRFNKPDEDVNENYDN